MSNSGTNSPEKMQILGRAELILTSTYHWENWSVLLGKRVIAFPFSTKFYRLGREIPLCLPIDWERNAARDTRGHHHQYDGRGEQARPQKTGRGRAAAGAAPGSLLRGSPPQSRMRCSVLRSPN